ncbi:SDR family oxidoreductase [Streptomyces sp. 4N509B]|uniref:SDR family oxidoreductase n=1 Tax=Streptomyces sp. 4N509B TaxID=3457413 RepID=UPI003FD3FB82
MNHRIPLSLAGQVAVVTGAARGLGAALARELALRGARVALVGLEPERLARVADSLPAPADQVGHWHADVTDAAAMDEVAREVRDRFGAVDIVVANAGVGLGGSFESVDAAHWRRVIDVNLVGSATTCRAFLPALKDSQGYFCQVASLAALTPAPMMTAYCASKSGVEAFAHSLRAELAPSGVRVGVAYLAWTDTDMVRAADEDEANRELRAKLPGPFGRTYPLAPTAARLAAGIERRSAHVYGQRWLRPVQAIRGALPPVVAAGARRMLRQLPSSTVAQGLLGPGGAAASRETARAPGEAAPAEVASAEAASTEAARRDDTPR